MTHVITAGKNRVVVIEDQKDQSCDLCRTIAECRPYGPDGKNICFDCGLKNEPQTYINMIKILYDKEISVEEATRQLSDPRFEKFRKPR